MTWQQVRFGDLYKIPSRNGLMRPKRVRGEGYKMVNMGEIFAYDRIDNPEMELVPMNNRELKTYNLKPNDLLFARQSMVESGAGKCSIVLSTPEITTFESHLIRVRLHQDQVLPLFYFYYFLSPIGKGTIQSIVTGAAQKGIRGAELQNLMVPLPTYSEQEKIAGILCAYDDLIANNEKRIALLEEAIHLLYREWFVHLRFPGHEGVAVNAGIPEGWQQIPIGELCNVIMGQSPKSEFYNSDGEGLPFHQGVKDFGERFITHQTYCTQFRRIAKPYDILFSVRAPVGRLNITLDKIVIGRGLSAMRNRRNNQSFQFYQLKNFFFKENIIGGGAIFASVTKKQLLGLPLLTPTRDLIDKFEYHAAPADKQIENLHKQNERLQEARDALLPRLMSGKLSV